MAAVNRPHGEDGISPRIIAALRAYPIRDEAALAAMAKVPRRAFLDEAMRARADDDDALPIGREQTTSQPLIIMRMLEMMRAGKRRAKVLEVGAGCGYQTALLAELSDEVFAMERIATLAAKARRNLAAQGYRAVRVKHGDGAAGLPEAAPFDGIIVAASAREIPAALVAQLAPDARLVLPLIGGDDIAQLTAVGRADGEADAAEVADVAGYWTPDEWRDGKAAIVARGEKVAFVPLLDGTA